MNSAPTLPKVSIITPSFNQGQFLEASIRSVLEQDYPNLEYIVVDGGSKDDSVEVIKKYQDRLAWWVSEKDKGHADALNKGFARATGEILAWLNSDDIYFPGAVTEAVSVLQNQPEVGMVYGDADLIADDLAYTTVLTVLRTLEAKGHVGHEIEGRAHLYFPRTVRREAARQTVDHLIDKVFQGSPDLMHMGDINGLELIHFIRRSEHHRTTPLVIISTQSDLASAVVGAIGALKGPLHGGANEAVMDMMEEIGDPDLAADLDRPGEEDLAFGRNRLLFLRLPPRTSEVQWGIGAFEGLGLSGGHRDRRLHRRRRSSALVDRIASIEKGEAPPASGWSPGSGRRR